MSPSHEQALPAAYLVPGSSFTDFVRAQAPEVLPSGRALPAGMSIEAPHGTTIVSIAYGGGILLAGDRRATMGNIIANRDMEKVFVTDEYSAVGIAGTAGVAIELVRLFQVELEHYEKIEGALMSLEGKANRLASMIRSNLSLAMQGLAVVPMFAGYDVDTASGRIFSYDVTGGCYEEHDHHSVGSGSLFARGSMKKLWRSGLDRRRSRPGRDRGALRRRGRRLGDRRARPDPPALADHRARRRRGRALPRRVRGRRGRHSVVTERTGNPGGAR